jgi:hypothetical protein
MDTQNHRGIMLLSNTHEVKQLSKIIDSKATYSHHYSKDVRSGVWKLFTFVSIKTYTSLH